MKTSLPHVLLALLIFLALLSSACMAVTGALPATAEFAPESGPETQATIEMLLTQGAAPQVTAETAATAEIVYTQAASTQMAAIMTQAAAGGEPTKAPEPSVTAITAHTAAPMATSAAAPAVALPAGLEVFRHPEMPGFVFPADPNTWQRKTDPQWPYVFLVHRDLPECEILAVPGRGIGTPQRLLRWQLGRLQWLTLDYISNALVRLDRPQRLFLELHNFDNGQCRAAQQDVMEWVMLEDELSGKVPYDLLPTPTLRPPLPGFSCPNMPPVRLRVNDQAWIVTNDLILRAQPRPSSDTVIRTYDSTDPVIVQITGGPVCTEKFVYWNARVSLIGEGVPEPLDGWFAEGDLREYFLEPADMQ